MTTLTARILNHSSEVSAASVRRWQLRLRSLPHLRSVSEAATAIFAVRRANSMARILQGFQRAPILGATGGFIAFGAGLLIFKRCHPRGLHRVALLLASLSIVAVLQLVVFAARPGEAVTTLQRMKSVSTGEDNTKVRLLYWGAGLEMFRSHPLVGVGANNYEVAFSKHAEVA